MEEWQDGLEEPEKKGFYMIQICGTEAIGYWNKHEWLVPYPLSEYPINLWCELSKEPPVRYGFGQFRRK